MTLATRVKVKWKKPISPQDMIVDITHIGSWYGHVGKDTFVLDATEKHQTDVLAIITPVTDQLAERRRQVVESLDIIVHTCCTKDDVVALAAQGQHTPGVLTVGHRELGGRDGIGNDGNGLVADQCTLLGPVGQPLTDRHEMNMSPGKQFLFLVEDAVGKVMSGGKAQERTVVALRLVLLTGIGMVTDGRRLPHVVHGPHDGFPALQDLAEGAQREEALIDPMQMDDICFLKLRQTSDIGARIGYRHLEEVLATEEIIKPDDQSLGQEMPLFQHVPAQSDDRRRFCLLVANKHLCFDAVVVQRDHQTLGSDSRPTRAFTRVDNQYPHPILVAKIMQNE